MIWCDSSWHDIVINGSLDMSFQLEMHHFLWISHQFWVSPLLTLRSACVLIERKFTAIFARRRPDPGVEFILCNTHTHTLWEVSAWEFLLQLGFALGLVLCTGAWWFALDLVLCAGAWCKPLHHRFFHLRPINAPKQIACLCETFLGIIKLLGGSLLSRQTFQFWLFQGLFSWLSWSWSTSRH